MGAAGRHDRIPRIQSVRPCPDGAGTTTSRRTKPSEPVKLDCLESHVGDCAIDSRHDNWPDAWPLTIKDVARARKGRDIPMDTGWQPFSFALATWSR